MNIQESKITIYTVRSYNLNVLHTPNPSEEGLGVCQKLK